MRSSISRAEVFAICRSLGADPTQTQHVGIEPLQVTVTTYRLDDQGGRYLDEATKGAAVEVTKIPLVGDGGAQVVRMQHPELGVEVDVPASAVGVHAVAGWEVVSSELEAAAASEPGGLPEPGAEEQPEPTAPDTDSKPPIRRRKTKESD